MNLKSLICAVAAAVGVGPALHAETMKFSEGESALVLEADRELTGLLFEANAKVTISGGHALTLNVASDTEMDQYRRLFCGNNELTVTGAGTAVSVNPKASLQQSSNVKIVAENGASFTNAKWDTGDNGGYEFIATGDGSAITLQLVDTAPAEAGSWFSFAAKEGGAVSVNKAGNKVMNIGALGNHTMTAVADGGTLTLTGVQITGTAIGNVSLKGSGTAAFDAFTPAGGTLTLVADADWSDATPHLTTAGNLSFAGEVTFDVAALGEFTGEKKFLIGQAGGSATFNPSKVELKNGPDGYVATCSVEGKNVYVTVKDGAVTTPYWRWTSNATEGDSAVWTIVDDGGALSVPAFTGTTAEDNVIELLEDCKVTSILTFSKSCTIRTKPDLEVTNKVTFASADVYCLVGNAAVKTSNVTFDGMVNGVVVGSAAWGLKTGGGSLTLGDGVTVCNFKPAGRKIDSNFDGVIVIATQTATLNILEGAKICDISGVGAAVTVINKTAAVVNMSGGEITRCTSTSDRRGGGAIGLDSGTLNLSGGSIHGNTASCGAGGICVVNDGWDGFIKVSGNPKVCDNKLNGAVANVGLTDGAHGTGHFILAGDLEDGAYVGCSYNIGEGNQFGTADGKYTGANFIHADDGSKFVGRVRQGNLIWGIPAGFLLFVR